MNYSPIYYVKIANLQTHTLTINIYSKKKTHFQRMYHIFPIISSPFYFFLHSKKKKKIIQVNKETFIIEIHFTSSKRSILPFLDLFFADLEF